MNYKIKYYFILSNNKKVNVAKEMNTKANKILK